MADHTLWGISKIRVISFCESKYTMTVGLWRSFFYAFQIWWEAWFQEVFSRPFYIIVMLKCSRIHCSSHNDLVQMKQSKGFLIPWKKLIVCNLEVAMQLVVLILDSPFKVHCAFTCRISNITVYIHIILCANICNISISISNKVVIE